MKYFIADTHFDHNNIIRLSKRPFETMEEHDAQLINNWNNQVNHSDEIYILGDLSMSRSGKHVNSLLDKLNGRKHLIIGNHDAYLNDKSFDRSKFESIQPYLEFNYSKVKFVLFHYPILEWNGFFKDSIHLYGHVHNNNKEYFEKTMPTNTLNVGVDIIGYKPISINEVLSRV